MVLTNSFQAPLYPTIDMVWIKGQPEVEDLPIVAVVVPDSCPAREALFPPPPDDPLPTMVSDRFPPQPAPRNHTGILPMTRSPSHSDMKEGG
jgi:hypothetical protein